MDLTVTGRTKVIPPTAAQLYDGQMHDGILYPDRYQWLPLELAEPNLGIPMSGIDLGSLITGSYAFSSTQTFLLCSNQRGERGWVAFNAAEQQFDSEERPDLTNVDMGLEWLLYREPLIINFQLSSAYFNDFRFRPGIEGGGPSIDILLRAGVPFIPETSTSTLSWVTNKVDERAIRFFYLRSADGVINDTITNTITGNGSFRKYTLNIDTSTPTVCTFSLTAQDWRKFRDIRTITIRALGPLYFGVTAKTSNASINENDFKFQSNFVTGSPETTYSFTVPQDGTPRRFIMAWPRDLNFYPTKMSLNGSPLFITIISSDFIEVPVEMESGVIIPYTVYITKERYNQPSNTVRLIR